MTTTTLDRAGHPARPRAGARVRWPARHTWGRLALSLPLMLVLGVLVLLPIAFVVYGAFQSAQPGDPASVFSTDAISRVYGSTEFVRTYVGTALLALGVAVASTFLGCVFAWLIGRTDLPARKSLEVLVMAPIFLSPFLGAIAWVDLAAPNSGIINNIWRSLTGAGPTDHLVSITNIVGVGFVVTLYYTPYAFLFVLAALRNMDPSLEEASYMNGAGKLRTAMRVTFPLVRPAVGAAFFFISVLACGIFTVPVVLATTGSFVPLAVRVQRGLTSYPSTPALSAALGTVMVLVTLVGIIFYRRSIAQAAKFVTVSGKGFRPRTVKLGVTAKAAGLAGCGLFVLLGVVLPYATLILVSFMPYTITDLGDAEFTLKPWRDVLESPGVRSAFANTLTVGVLVPTIGVVIGVAVAYAVNRARVPGRGIVDFLATIPVAVPGLVLGTGMVWAYITTSIYSTLTIIVMAFVCEYLPYASRMSGNALIQIDKSLEEASRINGAGRLRTLWRVTVPLSRTTILSAWIMIFIFATREISSAVVLSGPDTNLLSVVSWGYMNDGSLAQAAIVGLIQTALLLVVVLASRLVFRIRLSSVAA